MARNKKKDDREKRRASVVDQMIVYLECADVKPPVRELYPLIGEMIAASAEVSKSLPLTEKSPPLGGVGMIGSSELEGYTFQVDIAEPVNRLKLKNLMRMMPTSMNIVLPAQATELARTSRYYISIDGKVMTGIPKFYYQGGGGDGVTRLATWIPVAAPLQLGTRRTVNAGGYREHTVFSSDGDGVIPCIINAMVATSRVMWSVSMSAENGRSYLRFLTSESGAVGFYDLRNAPLTEGGRKAALRHFVNSHIRKPDSKVREHFRGREEFDWFGLKCCVIPPESLVEKVEAAKQS